MTAPKRRWFRFTLRTLFVVMTVLACWLGWNLRQIRSRDALLKSIEQRGAKVYLTTRNGRPPELRLPPLYYMVGSGPIGRVAMRHASFTDEEFAAVTVAFPEAELDRLIFPRFVIMEEEEERLGSAL